MQYKFVVWDVVDGVLVAGRARSQLAEWKQYSDHTVH